MQRDYLPALVLTRSQDDAETLNRALRGAGHAMRTKWVSNFDELARAIKQEEPDLIVSYTKGAGAGLAKVVELRDEHAPLVPVIAISNDADESSVAKAIQNGARDLVSLEETERLIAVVTREFGVLRQARALQAAREQLQEYEKRFEGIVSETADALAYVQEGIHVDANPAYLELFGYEDKEALEGMPVMDLFAPDSQKILKTLIRNTLKGKTQDETTELKGRHQDGSEFDLTLEMRSLEMDGEPAVELAIRSEASDVDTEGIIQELERRDSLTGLFNRAYFGEVLTQRFGARQDDGQGRALLYIRPDKFDVIKDKIGTVASDDILKKLAAIVREHADESDFCARFSDNIITVLSERGNISIIEQWADELRNKIASEVFEAGGQSTALTCSIGVGEMKESVDTPDTLLSHAEQAATQASKAGGNKVVRYEPPETDEEGQLSDHAWVKRIKAGVEKDLFQVVSQPIADLAGGDSSLFDILVQLRDENGKQHEASDFMEAAERNRLMVLIDRWVVENALKVLEDRHQRGEKHAFFIRIHHQTLGDAKLLEWIERRVQKTSIPKQHIVFEISEASVDKRLKEAKSFSATMRKHGCGIAIEHFGIGHNPTQTLQHLEMDYLKIDASFMDGLESDEDKQAQVEGFVKTAQSRKIATVAEGVEDAHTMASLFQVGIAYIQGNYVQEPEVVMAEPQ